MTGAPVADRVWAAVLIVAVSLVVLTSDVGLNLWFVSGLAADAVALVYVLVLVLVLIEPDGLGNHRVAAPLSVLFWGGRAAAFLDLVLAGQRFDLLGAVAERMALMVATLTLHLVAVHRIGVRDALKATAHG